MAKLRNLIFTTVFLVFTLPHSTRVVTGHYEDYVPIPYEHENENDQYEDDQPIESFLLPIVNGESPIPTSTDSTSVSFELNDASEPTSSIFPSDSSSTVSEEDDSPGTNTSTTENDGLSTSAMSASTEGSVTSSSSSTPGQQETTIGGATTEEGDTTSGSSTTVTYYPPFTDTTTQHGESTTTGEPRPEPAKERKSTWAIALISILIVFTGLFTVLYCFRKYMLRKRQLDRRRLLSNSSQEGFFVGNEYGGSMRNL